MPCSGNLTLTKNKVNRSSLWNEEHLSLESALIGERRTVDGQRCFKAPAIPLLSVQRIFEREDALSLR